MATIQSTVSGTLSPGVVWVARKFGGATMPTVVGHSGTSLDDAVLTGKAALPGSAAILTALSTVDAYANAFPTMAGSETFAEVTANGIPIIWAGL